MVVRHLSLHRSGTRNLVPIGEIVNNFLVPNPKSFPYRDIGNRIQDARRDKARSIMKRITQSRMAEELGVHVGTVTAWEIGKQRPEGRRLEQLAEYLGVSASFLVTGEESPESAVYDPAEGGDERPGVGEEELVQMPQVVRFLKLHDGKPDERELKLATVRIWGEVLALNGAWPDWFLVLRGKVERGEI
jgi:transcriptional regulator with XRE-family HTH domain